MTDILFDNYVLTCRNFGFDAVNLRAASEEELARFEADEALPLVKAMDSTPDESMRVHILKVYTSKIMLLAFLELLHVGEYSSEE